MSGRDPREDHWKLIAVFRICNAFGLTRADRLDIATTLLNRHIESFRELSPIEVDQMWFAFNGAMYTASLLMERKVGQRV